MDKAEYKAKLNDINELAEAGDFKAAADRADTIDWRHVKSPRTLAMISEIYEANKRYDDALRLMKSAYKRSNGAKSIVYRLAELSLKIGDVSAGRAYAEEFENMAGSDASKYVLRYKVKRTEGSPLSEQIKVLENLKEQEYTERWAYELARLYHKNGQDDKCVDECDDLILWFVEGRYVAKAMELKMEIRPLTAAQRRKYQNMISGAARPVVQSAPAPASEPAPAVEEAPAAPVKEVPEGKVDVNYTTSAGTPEMRMAFSENNRENVQNQLADSIRTVLSGVSSGADKSSENVVDYSAQTFPKEEVSYKDVMSLEKEASDHGVVEPERDPEEDAEQQMSLDDLTADEEIDLKDLFAETGSKLASALAEDDFEVHAITADDDIPEAEITPVNDEAEAAAEEAVLAVEKETVPAAAEEAAEDADDPNQMSFDFAGMLARTVAEAQERIVAAPTKEVQTVESVETEEAAEEIKDDLPDIQIDMSAVEAVEKAARQEGLLKTEEVVPAEEAVAETAAVSDDKGQEMEDIRLGLTREFNFNAELQKAMTGGVDMQDAAKAVSSRAFAEAAQAQEAYEPIYDTQEIPRELLAEPREQAQNDMTGIVDISAMNDEFGVTEESRSIIENIMEEPERMMIVPVEPRRLDETETKTFTYFARIPGIAEQVTQAIADVHNNAGDKTSMSGNVVIVGRQGSGKTRLADALVLSICRDLNIKAAKMAHIIADDLNKKDAASLVAKLSGGFLIIEGAGAMSEKTVADLSRAMEFRTDDMVVILEDEKQDMRDMLKAHPEFASKFTSQITVPVFTNDELVTFGRTYCKELGYKMDEMCVLALYTMIGDNQKDREPVTVGKVQSMIDTAIARAEKGSRRLGRRLSKKETDESGRIILHEKDFNF